MIHHRPLQEFAAVITNNENVIVTFFKKFKYAKENFNNPGYTSILMG